MLAFCGLGGGSKAAAGIDADDPVKPSAARPSVQHITASGRASMQASTRMPMLPSTAAPRPWNEPVRVQYLRSLGVLETVAHGTFLSITQLCCQLLNMPLAAVQLVDSERVWTKSAAGTMAPLPSIARDNCICSWVVAAPEPRVLVVPDATADTRFCNFPHVAGAPHVRFYAGSPLVSQSGLHLGTLCVIDLQPRQLDAGACNLLANLASLVARQLEAPALAEFEQLQREASVIIGRCEPSGCAVLPPPLPGQAAGQEAGH